jgi:signal transduction histidine kinase
VSNGKLNTKIVQTKSDDEIREVSESFNKMIKDIKKAQSQIQTQLKELTKVDEQKDEFAAMVSHELKTPIVPIQLYIEMFLQGSLGTLDDKQKKVLRTIHNNILSLNELVDDVLDVTKLELGRLQLHKKQVDLKDLLDENIKSLSILANDKKVALKLDLKTSEKIFCDPKRINQILSNLIKNSIDYVPKNIGLIKLTIEKNPESFIFTVTDNGPGISVENHKHLFEKFYKMDTSITRKHGGTGLGLTICNGIVSSHGGKIWLDKEYTKGASFKFTIPVEES